MILIVTYDLKGPYNYIPFYEALKQQGSWWHYLTSTWLISTAKTPEQVFQAISPLMLTTDRMLIFELGKTYNGWLPKDAWEWIQQQQAAEAIRSVTPSTPLPTPPPGLGLPKIGLSGITKIIATPKKNP